MKDGLRKDRGIRHQISTAIGSHLEVLSSHMAEACLEDLNITLLACEMRTSLVVQRVKRLPTMWETWVRSLGREDPMEEGMANHPSSLAWRIPMGKGAWQAI